MKEFNTSLVREKIIFSDDGAAAGAAEPTIIRSNRIFLKLTDGRGVSEKVVIRAQNMHSTLRFAARVLFSFQQSGLLVDRTVPFDWEEQWESVISRYEEEYNTDIWASVYINGKSVFRTTTSPFVDVIEKCALLSLDNYDGTMEVTETMLKQVGRPVRIEHTSNVAATFAETGPTTRCGIVHRSGNGHTMTFTFNATGGQQDGRIIQCINMAAAFLEVFNLRFTIRSLQEKIRNGEVPKASRESGQIHNAIRRQKAIAKVIAGFEEVYGVRYRPEKPDLFTS